MNHISSARILQLRQLRLCFAHEISQRLTHRAVKHGLHASTLSRATITPSVASVPICIRRSACPVLDIDQPEITHQRGCYATAFIGRTVKG